MSDEIKGILKDLEYASGVFDYTITPDRCTLLLDYITNLQQDNTMYARLKNEYEEEIKDLQQRIDKSIEYIEHSNYDIIGRVCSFTKLLNILKGDSNENN